MQACARLGNEAEKEDQVDYEGEKTPPVRPLVFNSTVLVSLSLLVAFVLPFPKLI